jgi:hypothetical protein
VQTYGAIKPKNLRGQVPLKNGVHLIFNALDAIDLPTPTGGDGLAQSKRSKGSDHFDFTLLSTHSCCQALGKTPI